MIPVRVGIIESLILSFNVAFAVKRAEMGWIIRTLMSEYVDGQEKTVSPSPKIAYPGRYE